MTPSDTGSNHGDGPGNRRHRLGHDIAGVAHPAAITPGTGAGRVLQPSEQIASRSTDEEARDLLSLRRAKRGDTGAFAELIKANDRDVRALLVALLGAHDIDSVCAGVYLRAFRGLSLAPNTSPRIWLLGIADGAARDNLRRSGYRSGAESGTQAAMSGLPIPIDVPAEERLVLAAIDSVGLTPREAARLIDGGIDRVRTLLASARERPGLATPFAPPPDHFKGFWDDLGRRLLVERSAPAATAHRGTLAEAPRPESPAGDKRRAAAARGLIERVEQRHPRTVPWRRIGLTIAVVASVMVLIGTALTVAGRASRRDADLGETATKTLDQLDAALARNTVVSGTFRLSVSDTVSDTVSGTATITGGSYRFSRSNDGSWQVAALDESVEEGYDVPSATMITIQRSARSAPMATVRSGLAPGPPEVTGTSHATLGDVLADAIRIVRSGTSGVVTSGADPASTTSTGSASTLVGRGSVRTTVAPTTTEGRRVWIVTSSLPETTGPALLSGTGALGTIRADQAELVADRSLALPTRLTLRFEGRVVATLTFSGLSISQQARRSSFAPRIRPGVAPTRHDAGFSPTEVGLPVGSASESPPTPSFLPGGYVLTAAGADTARRVIVLCYRNGSRQLILTRRPVPSEPAGNASPFASEAATDVDARTFTVDSGALAGREGHAAKVPIGHVWANGSATQVIVAGDPPIAQLSKVLASLR